MLKLLNKLSEESSISPLISFRILFGLLMFLALTRNLVMGFVHKFYIEPNFFFKYYGFEWVQPLGTNLTFVLYFLLIASSLGIMLGAFYRFSSILFFLLFTYFELIDLTHYLNHYYLISLLSFLLIFLPANRSSSIDVFLNPSIIQERIPRWCILLIQYQLALVYFFAGIAKLQPDWLLYAQPLKIWLGRLHDVPLFGTLLILPATAYIFSWFAAIYDLAIPFFLWNKRSRTLAYFAVVIFHSLTGILFNIGIFPIAMIAFSLIFFSEFWHKKINSTFDLIFILTLSKLKQRQNLSVIDGIKVNNKVPWFIWIFVFWQLLFPLRHWLYPGNVHWTEEGFRFSWKVMVVEKTGNAIFKVIDKDGKESQVLNADYLTEKQETFMSYQPDMILQFAHFLAKTYENKGYKNPKVYVDCFVTLNGSVSRRLIDPKVDLAAQKTGIHHKSWIMLYNDL
jgi:hypothetical protein